MFRVHDLTNFTVYTVKSSKEGRDSTDRSAIECCEETGEVITMGKVMVEPVQILGIYRKDKK